MPNTHFICAYWNKVWEANEEGMNIYKPMNIYFMYSDQSYTWLLICILSLETFHAEYADKTLQ